MPVANQMRGISAENRLISAGNLRRDNIDGFVLVGNGDACLGQFLCNAGTKHFGSLQAEDRIDRL